VNPLVNRWLRLRFRLTHSADRGRTGRRIERRSPGGLTRCRNAGIGTRHGRAAPFPDDAWIALLRIATGSGVPSDSPPSRRKTSCAGVRSRSSEATSYKEKARKAKQALRIHGELPRSAETGECTAGTPLGAGAEPDPGESKRVTRGLTPPYGNWALTRKLAFTCGDAQICRIVLPSSAPSTAERPSPPRGGDENAKKDQFRGPLPMRQHAPRNLQCVCGRARSAPRDRRPPHLSRPGDPEAIAGPRAKVGGCAGRYHQPPRHSQSEKQTTP
jgi:hypothetical protein